MSFYFLYYIAMHTITILWVDIELDSEQLDKLKKSLLNEDNWDLANDFANIIVRLKAKDKWVEELLMYTSWTIGKMYDDEEENDIIVEDTSKWMKWEADYMYD